MSVKFWWLIGFPLWWSRRFIGEGPYGWAHVRWLRAYWRSIDQSIREETP